MKEVTIYTDGACSGNPGPGGWAAILTYKGNELELAGGLPLTTNNQMELIAAIEGLRALKEPCKVKKPALNKELWQDLLKQLERHEVTFFWVKGHAGHPENERCDKLAVAESQKQAKIPM